VHRLIRLAPSFRLGSFRKIRFADSRGCNPTLYCRAEQRKRDARTSSRKLSAAEISSAVELLDFRRLGEPKNSEQPAVSFAVFRCFCPNTKMQDN